MSRFNRFIIKLLHREEGASALEYALLAAMVAVAIAAFVPTINAQVKAIFQLILNTLTTATGSGGGGGT